MSFISVPDGSSVLFHRTQDPSYFPGPPSKPVAIETKSTSVMLSWQPNSNSGASPVFAYKIEYFSHETTEVNVICLDFSEDIQVKLTLVKSFYTNLNAFVWDVIIKLNIYFLFI